MTRLRGADKITSFKRDDGEKRSSIRLKRACGWCEQVMRRPIRSRSSRARSAAGAPDKAQGFPDEAAFGGEYEVVPRFSPSAFAEGTFLRRPCGCVVATCKQVANYLPFAVPGALVGGKAPSSLTDRCHSLRSLHPPPAALPSLPARKRKRILRRKLLRMTRKPKHFSVILSAAKNPFPYRQRRCGALHRKITDSSSSKLSSE